MVVLPMVVIWVLVARGGGAAAVTLARVSQWRYQRYFYLQPLLRWRFVVVAWLSANRGR